MKIRNFWKKVNKPVTTAAILAGVVLLFLLLAESRSVRPENPMEEEADASRMYVTSSQISLDESLLENVPNANLSQTDANEEMEQQQQENSEEPKEEETDEPEEQPQEQEQEQYDEELEDENSSQSSSYDSLIPLIQKNDKVEAPTAAGTANGETTDPSTGDGSGDGGYGDNPAQGGAGSTLTPEESGELFYTSIIDGEVVLDPVYFFTITLTERGKALTLVSQTVSVNGTSRSFVNGDSVTLSEGANKIQVTLRFRDKEYNQIDAPTKTYTVYYFKETHYYISVENAKTNQVIENGSTVVVLDPELWIKVVAQQGTKEVNARVRLNNGTVYKDSDGLHKMNLKVGNNTLKITVGSGGNQKVFTCTINYQTESFAVQFESLEADDEGTVIKDIITEERFGGVQAFNWHDSDGTFKFRISCTQATGLEKITYVGITQNGVTTDVTHRAGASGYISMNLEAFHQNENTYRGNRVYVEFTDSNGQLQNYTWTIIFKRTETPPDKEPYVIFDLVDGVQLRNNPSTVTISATDWRGNALNNWNFAVYLNGAEAPFININPRGYEYELNLYEGPNTFVLIVTDNEQYSITKTLTINYTSEQEIYYVNLTVGAGVLGLGPWIQETIPVTSDQTVAQIVEERLAAYGFATDHSGTATDSSYYLRRISRGGLLEGWTLTEDQIKNYGDEGYIITEPTDLNSLGEGDFSVGSGWMVSIDGAYITGSMGTTKPGYRSSIVVQFTCDLGRDL